MPEKVDREDSKQLLAEIENLKIENLLLKQKVEAQQEFKKHTEDVERQINKGQLGLGVVGVVLLGLAWYGTSQQFGSRLQERLDKIFSTEEIRELISETTTRVAHPIVQGRVTEFTKAENHRLRCVILTQGRYIFELQCHSKGGEFDSFRDACTDPNGGESEYENPFPRINCGDISNSARQGTRN